MNRQQRKEKRKADEKKATAKAKPVNTTWRTVRVHVFALVAVGVLALWFDKTLQGHHKITTTTDHTPTIIAGAIAVLGILLLVVLRKRMMGKVLTGVLAVLIGGSALAFTLITERPDAHLNPERKGLTVLSKLYKDSYLREWPLYANHAWFFWPDDLGYPDPAKYRTLNKAALDTAPVHSIALWENHYSHRLQGDMQLADMYKRKDMVELCHLVGSDHRLTTGLFQKVDTTVAGDREALQRRFQEAYPTSVYAAFAQSMELTRTGKRDEALLAAQRMVALDSLYPESHMTAGQAYFDVGRYTEAAAEFEAARRRDTALYTMDYSIGLSLVRAKQYRPAIDHLRAVLKRDKKLKAAYETLGYAYSEQQQYDSAVTVLSEVVRLEPNNANAYFQRGNAYYMAQRGDQALADYEQALKLNPNDRLSKMNKAIVLANMGRRAEGCALLMAMAQAGDAQAAGYAASLCGGVAP